MSMSMAHSSPGMMLQFAIAGLMTAAAIIVSERKSRSLQRLLTTATSRVHILIGHYLAMFALIFGQFVMLMTFGQLILQSGLPARPAGDVAGGCGGGGVHFRAGFADRGLGQVGGTGDSFS